MWRYLLICMMPFILMACACGNSNNDYRNSSKEASTYASKKMSVQEYIDIITGFTCEKAALTDNGYLVIAINATSDSGYDFLASQFLDEAKSEGVSGLKGVLIVDIKNCEFQKGAVVGKRIGKAYN